MKHIHYYFILLAAFMDVPMVRGQKISFISLPPLLSEGLDLTGGRPWPYGVKTLALRREDLDLIK